MSDNWKLTLPCTRAEAEALPDANLERFDPPPVLMTSEPDPARPEAWRLDAYFDHEPTSDEIAWVRALVPSARKTRPEIAPLGDEDWLTLSQAGLEPVSAGRFFVRNRGEPAPAGAIALDIPAGRAFGTGQHETTTGCLLTLDAMRRGGAIKRDILDLGAGTGLLAFAALKLWPSAHVIASDIDPVAIEVTAENAAANRIRIGRKRGVLALAVATGLDDDALRRRAPYDLIIANILAGPLIDLAPDIVAALSRGGTLILAGLLDSQASAVARAYRRQGLRLAGRLDRGDWPTLRMVKRG